MNQIKVTYFSSPVSIKSIVLGLNEVLCDFKNGKYADKINNVRKALSNGKENYTIEKRKLPVIAFCGEFKDGHSKLDLKEYNGLFIFDIDDLTIEEMAAVREKLIRDEYVLSLWISPSGLGYKGLVRINYLNEQEDEGLNAKYKKAFLTVKEYFRDSYGVVLDNSGSDFSRLCFVCWDEDLYFNEQAKVLNVDCAETIISQKESVRVKSFNKRSSVSLKKIPVNVKGKNKQHDRTVIASIVRFLNKRNLSITESYDDWIRVGFAIANTFNYDLGLKYYLQLSSLDKEKFDNEECANKLIECYKSGTGEVTLGTIVDMARKKGYIVKGSSEGS